MNAQTKVERSPLDKLREPFPPHHISKLPKETKAQTEARKTDKSVIVWKCEECGGMHHKNAVHLDYVGHAALTDRLLDTDPHWSWEPVSFGQDGLPAFDRNGGLWIKLTVLGVTRLGYGAADGKTGGDAIKEVIGDALRNAAMRFGAALDLWHKGDLHPDESEEEKPAKEASGMPDAEWSRMTALAKASGVSSQELTKHFKVQNLRMLNQQQYAEAIDLMNTRLAEKAKAETNSFGELVDDEIPY